MRRMATAFLVLAGLAVASTAPAVDFTQKGGAPQGATPTFKVAAVLLCDNGNQNNAFFQDDLARYGNRFNFGAGSVLTSVEFVHFGFGFAGPYNYDIELWDATSCTPIASVNNLVAADAAGAPMVESENVCASNIQLTGDVIVAIDANSCLVPTDCYPDVIFDDNLAATCQYVVDATNFQCIALSGQSGAFLLRVDTNNCPVPVTPSSWGGLKQIYR